MSTVMFFLGALIVVVFGGVVFASYFLGGVTDAEQARLMAQSASGLALMALFKDDA